jgi:hypothetical protein
MIVFLILQYKMTVTNMSSQSHHSWSEPEAIKPYVHSNNFGRAIFTPVSPFLPVSEITTGNLPIINDVLVSLDDAEKVTLITGNNRGVISICFPLLPEKTCFGLQYSCPSRAAVCRIDIEQFHTNDNTTAETKIKQLASNSIASQAWTNHE